MAYTSGYWGPWYAQIEPTTDGGWRFKLWRDNLGPDAGVPLISAYSDDSRGEYFYAMTLRGARRMAKHELKRVRARDEKLARKPVIVS